LSELQQHHQKQQQCLATKKNRFGFSNELSFLGLEADLTSFPWQDTAIKKEKMDMLIAQ
jgi:predicted ATP-dependent serine protease